MTSFSDFQEVSLDEETALSHLTTISPREKLEAMKQPINIKEFMGRWFVHAHIPSFIDANTVDNIEDYVWDEERELICVTFSYRTLNSDKSIGKVKQLKQHGRIVNEACTEWTMSIKVLVYWPLSTRYLLLAVNEGEEISKPSFKWDIKSIPTYNSCMVGVPDRSLLWIMSRNGTAMSDTQLNKYIRIAENLGYMNARERLARVPVTSAVSDAPSSRGGERRTTEDMYESFPREMSGRDSMAGSTEPALGGMRCRLDLDRFMGRWYVHGHIPSFFDKGTSNNIEEYTWDPAKKRINVQFRYTTALKNGSPGIEKTLQQSARVMNADCTEWVMSLKLLVYWPLPLSYLILAVNEGESRMTDYINPDECIEYSSALIGVSDRSLLWVMSRSMKPMPQRQLDAYITIAESLGYVHARDLVERVPFNDDVLSNTDDPTIRAASVESTFLESRSTAMFTSSSSMK